MPPFIRSLIAATAAVAALAGVVLLANQGVEADAATTTVPAPTYPVVDQLDGDGQDRFDGRTLQDFLHMDIGSDRSMTLNLAQALNERDLAFAEFLTTGAPEVTAEQLEFLMSFAPYGDASCFTVGSGERQCNISSDAFGITVTFADDLITIVRVDGAANDGL